MANSHLLECWSSNSQRLQSFRSIVTIAQTSEKIHGVPFKTTWKKSWTFELKCRKNRRKKNPGGPLQNKSCFSWSLVQKSDIFSWNAVQNPREKWLFVDCHWPLPKIKTRPIFHCTIAYQKGLTWPSNCPTPFHSQLKSELAA